MKVFLKILLVVFTLSSTTAFASGMDGSCPHSNSIHKGSAYFPKNFSIYSKESIPSKGSTSNQEDKVTW